MEIIDNIENNQELEQLSIETDDTASVPDFLADVPKIVYKISDFEGPIELLYQLIKDAKIRIEDIFISEVTGQYVDIIRNTTKEDLDYDYAAEFITMAAELIYLKSDRTLPPVDIGDDPTDEDNERADLIRKIKEYALLKEESEKLRELETINRFYREPTYTEKDYRVALINFSLPKLVEAFANVLVKADIVVQENIPKVVQKEKFSVHDQMVNIREIISNRKTMQFTELFMPGYDKSDIVTTFLAVLELMKYGIVSAEQDEIFGNITIYAVEGSESTEISFEEEEDGKY